MFPNYEQRRAALALVQTEYGHHVSMCSVEDVMTAVAELESSVRVTANESEFDAVIQNAIDEAHIATNHNYSF